VATKAPSSQRKTSMKPTAKVVAPFAPERASEKPAAPIEALLL
jgi:hypothetical protein